MPGPIARSPMEVLLQGLRGGGHPDPDRCWNWTGLRNSNGYGRSQITQAKRQLYRMAHRLAWELMVGPIPQGFALDHRCLNKLCCNPAHLECVTMEENWRRGNRHRELGLYINAELGTHSPAPQLSLFDREDLA